MKGIEKLKEMMIGKVSMFSGHSGVGKSTWLMLNLKLKNKTEPVSKGSTLRLLLKCMTYL
jgi:ribosome biogenesis GTPase